MLNVTSIEEARAVLEPLPGFGSIIRCEKRRANPNDHSRQFIHQHPKSAAIDDHPSEIGS